MSDDNQIEIPQSFVALYLDPGRSTPNAPRELIAQRYEFCEDLACMLTETAKDQLFGLGINEEAVLQRCLQGLTGVESGVSGPEAVWVVRRLSELLDWTPPD